MYLWFCSFCKRSMEVGEVRRNRILKKDISTNTQVNVLQIRTE